MIIKFNYGIIYKGIKYGWYKKELYRLPYTNSVKYWYALKKLTLILIGTKLGYRLSGDKLTLDKLEELTHEINYTHDDLSDIEDCPF